MRRQRCLDQSQESIEPTQVEPSQHWAKECANTVGEKDCLQLYSVKLLPTGVLRLLSINILSLARSAIVIPIWSRKGNQDFINRAINPAKYILWQLLQSRHPCDVALVIVVPSILLAVLLDGIPESFKLRQKTQ